MTPASTAPSPILTATNSTPPAPITLSCKQPLPTRRPSPTASEKSPGANTRPTKPCGIITSIWPMPIPTPPRPRTSFKGCTNCGASHTERAMRVSHIITRLVVGGAQENTVATVLGLRRKSGVSVHLLSGPTTGPEGSLESKFADAPGLLTIVPELIRPVHPLKDFIALRKLEKILREQKPGIVHTHSGKAGILGRLAAKRAGVPIIIHHIHGPSFGNFQGAPANFLFTTAEKLAARVTDHFFCSASAMTRLYLAAGIGKPEMFTRIFSGFNLEPFLNASNNLLLRQQLGLEENHF